MEIYGNFFDDFQQRFGYSTTKDLVHIEVELLRICQQRCSYCFARNDTARWNTILKDDAISDMFEELNASIHPLRISLMGGEPALHPRLGEIVSRCLLLPKITEVEIFTNALKYVEMPAAARVICSYHPDACLDVNKFKENVLKYNARHPCIVYIMTVLTESEFPRMVEMYKWCNDHGIRSNLEYIFNTDGSLDRSIAISDDDYRIYQQMDKQTRYVKFGHDNIAIDDIYRMDLVHFQGARCKVSRLLKVDIKDPTTFRVCCNAQGLLRVPLKGTLSKEIDDIVCPCETCETLACISTYKNVGLDLTGLKALKHTVR